MDFAAPERQGLYNPANEHDACGVGFIAHIKGQKSHSIVQQGLQILKNLNHRGAVGADPLMGDGAGILIQIPDEFLREEMAQQGVTLPRAGDYGIGMLFLPKESASRLACQEEIERAVRSEGQIVLGWRDVPIDREMPMSPAVRQREPVIRQIFIGRGPNVMVGYYQNPALTREVIDAQAWFNTGDMASQGEDGALAIAGRSKELIIRSGFNVYPLEVEQVINAFPGVVQSAVVGRTVGHNEEVVAFIEVPAGREIDEAALDAHLRANLSPYKRPSEIRYMAQLPAAPTGKLLKGEIKQMAQHAAPIV